LFQKLNSGPVEVCLNRISVEAAAREFASFLKIHFVQEIDRDAKAFKKSVLRWIRRELPPRRGRPNDPRLDLAARMVHNGKTIKEVLRFQLASFDRMDTYGRYLAEKGLRAALARRKKHSRGIV